MRVDREFECLPTPNRSRPEAEKFNPCEKSVSEQGLRERDGYGAEIPLLPPLWPPCPRFLLVSVVASRPLGPVDRRNPIA
jgi:hypothetical protein